jgi:hypothetical protein
MAILFPLLKRRIGELLGLAGSIHRQHNSEKMTDLHESTLPLRDPVSPWQVFDLLFGEMRG